MHTSLGSLVLSGNSLANFLENNYFYSMIIFLRKQYYRDRKEILIDPQILKGHGTIGKKFDVFHFARFQKQINHGIC